MKPVREHVDPLGHSIYLYQPAGVHIKVQYQIDNGILNGVVTNLLDEVRQRVSIELDKLTRGRA